MEPLRRAALRIPDLDGRWRARDVGRLDAGEEEVGWAVWS